MLHTPMGFPGIGLGLGYDLDLEALRPTRAYSSLQVLEEMVMKAHRKGDRALVKRLRKAFHEAALEEQEVYVHVKVTLNAAAYAKLSTLTSTRSHATTEMDRVDDQHSIVHVQLEPKLTELEELDDSFLARLTNRVAELGLAQLGLIPSEY